MVRIFDTDTYTEIAQKIFEEFELFQSCSIHGLEIFGSRIEEKGMLVWNEIITLDEKENFHTDNHGRKRRRRIVPPNSNGVPNVQKQFKWRREVDDNQQPKYTIWRSQ